MPKVVDEGINIELRDQYWLVDHVVLLVVVNIFLQSVVDIVAELKAVAAVVVAI